MQLREYIKPELLVVSGVLYYTDTWLRHSKAVNTKLIPLINGILGILICSLYVFATSTYHTAQDIAMAAFTAITQGILVAGLSSYAQSTKYNNKTK